MVSRAEMEREEAIDRLKRANPNTTVGKKRILDAQNQIWRCEMFKAWLAEMVMEGRQALEILNQQRDENG